MDTLYVLISSINKFSWQTVIWPSGKGWQVLWWLNKKLFQFWWWLGWSCLHVNLNHNLICTGQVCTRYMPTISTLTHWRTLQKSGQPRIIFSDQEQLCEMWLRWQSWWWLMSGDWLCSVYMNITNTWTTFYIQIQISRMWILWIQYCNSCVGGNMFQHMPSKIRISWS